MNRKRIAITGVGLICSIGNTLEEFWQGIVAGPRGIPPVTILDPTAAECKIGGEIAGFDPAAHLTAEELELFDDRTSQLAITATREAIATSRVELAGIDSFRIGLVLGQCQGGLGDDGEAQ